MTGAFKTLLSKERDWRPGIEAMSFEVLLDQEARKLKEFFWGKRCLLCCWS